MNVSQLIKNLQFFDGNMEISVKIHNDGKPIDPSKTNVVYLVVADTINEEYMESSWIWVD